MVVGATLSLAFQQPHPCLFITSRQTGRDIHHDNNAHASCRSYSQILNRLHAYQNDLSNEELTLLEKQVVASTKSRIDMDRVLKALDGGNGIDNNMSGRRNDLMYEHEDLSRSPPTGQWQVAGAAAIVSGALSFVAFGGNYIFSAGICCFVFVAATLDDDSLSGALARILGRSAIQSVQASQPKIKALARAVVTGEEEIMELRAHVRKLEDENASLMQWKERRIMVDETLPRYTVVQLKEMAKQNGLSDGGTKTDLLFRLVEKYERDSE